MTDKAKKAIFAIEIPRDELALRIAMPCIGASYNGEKTATECLDDLNRTVWPMGETFRKAADAAVLYFHECIDAGSQPS